MSVYSSYTSHVDIEPLERIARRSRRPVRMVMNDAGVSRSTLTKIKSGRPVSITVIEMIAKVLECHPSILSAGYVAALHASSNPLDGDEPTAIVPLHKDRVRALMEIKGLNAIDTSRLMNRHDTAMSARLRSNSTHTTVDFARNLAAVLDIEPRDLISCDPSVDKRIMTRLDEVRARRARRAEAESASRDKALAGTTDLDARRTDDVLIQRAALLRSIFRRRMPITKFGASCGLSNTQFYSIATGFAPGPWPRVEAVVGDVPIRRSAHEDIAPASAEFADIGGGISLALLVADTQDRKKAMDACLTVPGSRLDQAIIEIETIIAAGSGSVGSDDEDASPSTCPIDDDPDRSDNEAIDSDVSPVGPRCCDGAWARRLNGALRMRSTGASPEGLEIIAQIGGRSRRLDDVGAPHWLIPLHWDGDMRIVKIDPDGTTTMIRMEIGRAVRVEGNVLTTVCDDPMALLIGVLTHGPMDREAAELAVSGHLDER